MYCSWTEGWGFPSIAGDVLHDFENSKLTESREVKNINAPVHSGKKV